MSSFCYCSRQHRELFLLILKSHLCLHLLLESSQTAIKESNSHKILCMQEASLETEDSVTFISDKQHNLIQAPVSPKCSQSLQGNCCQTNSKFSFKLKMPAVSEVSKSPSPAFLGHHGQSLICLLLRQTSSRKNLDVQLVNSQPAEGNTHITSPSPLFRLQILSQTAVKELLY